MSGAGTGGGGPVGGGVAERVRAAAVELFAAQGFAGTSVQQIVERAGVTKGGMYHWFRSKDDLLFGVYDSLLALQAARLAEIAGLGLGAEEALRRACEDVVATSLAHLPEGTVFFRSAHQLSAQRRAEVTRRRRAYHDSFAELVGRGQEAGLWRTDVPIAILVASFFAGVHYLPTWYDPAGPEPAELVARQLTDLFLASLRPAGEAPSLPGGAA